MSDGVEEEDDSPFAVLSFDCNTPRLLVNLEQGPNNPRLIGIALADVGEAIVQSLLDSELSKDGRGMTAYEIRDEMKQQFDQEWSSRTSKCEINRLS